MKTFIYPGSFDPVTNGHLDIISRASVLCDRLVVAVLQNIDKNHTFTLDERVDFIKRAIPGKSNVEVISYDGMLLDYLAGKNINIIIKGLRAVTDFEYEVQMAAFYEFQNLDIETLFMVAKNKYSFLSSTMVRNFAKSGGKIDAYVPDCIRYDIEKKFKKTGV